MQRTTSSLKFVLHVAVTRNRVTITCITSTCCTEQCMRQHKFAKTIWRAPILLFVVGTQQRDSEHAQRNFTVLCHTIHMLNMPRKTFAGPTVITMWQLHFISARCNVYCNITAYFWTPKQVLAFWSWPTHCWNVFRGIHFWTVDYMCFSFMTACKHGCQPICHVHKLNLRTTESSSMHADMVTREKRATQTNFFSS